MNRPYRMLQNGEAVPRREIPELSLERFQQELLGGIEDGWRVVSYFGAAEGNAVRLYAVLSEKMEGVLGVMTALATAREIPTLTPYAPQLHLFEREIAEQFGLVIEDHPWFKPVRFAPPLATPLGASAGKTPKIGLMDFYRVEGTEIHEVAVGPVHAGIIEPGHFRFQCFGEEVLHLEISLGYQHRAVERLVQGPLTAVTRKRMETVAGDTTIGHGTAHTMVVEALGGGRVPARAQAIRAVALELERLANHTGDLGAISGDVGYLPTASFCGRIRGDFLNLTAELCGNRFGRDLVVPGGVAFDVSGDLAGKMAGRLQKAFDDVANAVDLLWETPSVMARLEGTGVVSGETALEIGMVGPAARASGLNRDIRRDHPFGIYAMSHIPVETARAGDVYARTLVRWLEVEKSVEFIQEQLTHLPGVAFQYPAGAIAGDSLAVALTEGWRGEICHVGITDERGGFARYKITDPSFHNWTGLAMALREGQISDFPLCNKSFNLSYCGFDL
ncbi:NADH-quinone oxidoreductase subunit C [Geomonas sp. Red32]|uniref:hydrogenase large subunit n=1 Tax=Geomonas sp. Red32 TaxID=2912856 RepID=UPI00202CAA10|nr:NADH-quinone oxidoreductase subunit C [Geomonas sp. Red32]MCM0084358.1 NADH-quinone oxidoreductase subunit C [Geomonas sp. Red32]